MSASYFLIGVRDDGGHPDRDWYCTAAMYIRSFQDRESLVAFMAAKIRKYPRTKYAHYIFEEWEDLLFYTKNGHCDTDFGNFAALAEESVVFPGRPVRTTADRVAKMIEMRGFLAGALGELSSKATEEREKAKALVAEEKKRHREEMARIAAVEKEKVEYERLRLKYGP
jgi:hypothetical protein